MSLDGETNLKVRQCPRETRPLADAARLSGLLGTFECEAPNSRLYVFDGTLQIEAGLDEPAAADGPTPAAPGTSAMHTWPGCARAGPLTCDARGRGGGNGNACRDGRHGQQAPVGAAL